MQTLGIGSVNRFGAGHSVDDSGMEWLFGVSVFGARVESSSKLSHEIFCQKWTEMSQNSSVEDCLSLSPIYYQPTTHLAVHFGGIFDITYFTNESTSA